MKKNGDDLRLHEAALLLALRDKEGTILPGTMYQLALGGALLAELLMAGRAEVEGEKKTKYVRLAGPASAPLGDPILDECVGRIGAAKRRATLSSWVSRLANLPKLKHRIAERLCRARVLRVEEDQILLIFRRKVYPELDPVPEKRLVDGMRRAIEADAGVVEPRTSVLIALAHHTGLLKAVLPRAELRARRKRIEQIAKGEALGRAVKGAVEAAQAAIVAAAVVPAICAASS